MPADEPNEALQQFEMLSTVVEDIRREIESPTLYRQYVAPDTDRWSKFCVAMDILEDTLLAIGAYLDGGLGHSEEERYLRFYGLMQAVYIQEDAIWALWEVVMETQFEKPDDDSGWMTIREIRNHSAGHPVARRTFVVRMSLEQDRVSMITDDPQARTSTYGGGKHWGGQLNDLLAGYLRDANERLSAIAARVPVKWPLEEK